MAVKIFHDDEASVLARMFRAELEMLARLHHLNIVRFLGASTQAPSFCIIQVHPICLRFREAFLYRNWQDREVSMR